MYCRTIHKGAAIQNIIRIFTTSNLNAMEKQIKEKPFEIKEKLPRKLKKELKKANEKKPKFGTLII
jgi:hypothetical protein